MQLNQSMNFTSIPSMRMGMTLPVEACRSEQRKKRRQNQKNEQPTNRPAKIHPVYSNPELAKFTPRQLMDELKARGYSGELHITQKIKL